MQKAVLLVATVVAFLVPSVARAQVFGNSDASGTYAFSFNRVYTEPSKLCNGSAACGKVNNVNGSVGQFFKQFAKDLKKRGQCQGATAVLKGLGNTAAKITPKAGDQIFGAGTISLDGNGNIVSGFVGLNSTSTATEALNIFNNGTTGLLCGGVTSSALACNTLCQAASFNCDSRGGYNIGPDGNGTATVYIYPIFSAPLCGSSDISAARCCNDPSLVIIFRLSATVSAIQGGVASKIRGAFTDQAGAGSFDAGLQ
jgi:hypothetical protein